MLCFQGWPTRCCWEGHKQDVMSDANPLSLVSKTQSFDRLWKLLWGTTEVVSQRIDETAVRIFGNPSFSRYKRQGQWSSHLLDFINRASSNEAIHPIVASGYFLQFICIAEEVVSIISLGSISDHFYFYFNPDMNTGSLRGGLLLVRPGLGEPIMLWLVRRPSKYHPWLG